MKQKKRRRKTVGHIEVRSVARESVSSGKRALVLSSAPVSLIELDARLAEAAAQPRSDEELGSLEGRSAALREAVELPHHGDLPPEYKGMYVRYDSSCSGQHWGTPETVKMVMSLAYTWWKAGRQPTTLLGDISARNFMETGCHVAHKNGKQVDVDLAGTLPRDPGYGRDRQRLCALLCWSAIQLGAQRVLFSDDVVARSVNRLAEDKGLPGRVVVRADHDNHFHVEMP